MKNVKMKAETRRKKIWNLESCLIEAKKNEYITDFIKARLKKSQIKLW
jgi:hypothetical protein